MGEKYLSQYSAEEVVTDYIASMTDRYFLEAYNNLKNKL